MDVQELYQRLDKRLDRFEEKLDSHDDKLGGMIERVVKVEEKHNNLAGSIKVAFALIVTAVSSIIGYAVKHLFK